MPSVTRGPWEYLCSYICQHRVSCRGIPLASSVEKAHALWTLHMDFSTAGRLLTDIDLSSFHQPQDTSLLSFFAFSYLLVIWFHICFSHISGHHATAPMRFDVLSGSVVFHHLSGEASTVLPLLRGCLSKTSRNRSQMHYCTQSSVKIIFSLQRYFQSATTEWRTSWYQLTPSLRLRLDELWQVLFSKQPLPLFIRSSYDRAPNPYW